MEKVPLVAVEIFEDGDDTVGFVARRFEKPYVVGLHVTIVAPEIVGAEKQENASASLIADGKRLLGCDGLRQEKTGAAGVWGSDNEPALLITEGRVFEQLEAEGLREERKRLVVVAHE